MTRAFLVCGGLVLATIGVSQVQAQEPGGRLGGRGGFNMPMSALIGQESVRAELKLSSEQAKEIDDLVAEQRKARESGGGGGAPSPERFARMRKQFEEDDEKLTKLLKPEQTARLRQISLQLRGPGALADEKLAAQLKLSSEQVAKIKGVQDETAEKMREAYTGGGPRDDARKAVEKVRAEANTKIVALLNDEQQKQWAELTGEPFKGEIQRGGFGGGGGGRRRGE